MIDPDRLALEYLQAPAGSFWCWSEDGEALEWREGGTIAFREEVLAVLERLAPGGLPPFGAVVLLLGACRPDWEPKTRGWRSVIEKLARDEEERTGRPYPGWLGPVQRDLDRVHRLPEHLRQGAHRRAVLAEVVFDTRRRQGAERAAAVVRAFRAGLPPSALSRTRVLGALGGFKEDLYALVAGLSELDQDQLILRAWTGLDRLPEPVPTETLLLPDAVRELLAGLRDDTELGGLAALAARMLGTLRLARPRTSPEQLPLGGVADIANRGTLDRLLISELAHDAHTLAARVALGEALYLRREVPPADTPVERVLLLDVGIRLWGVTRVHATAVGLALAAGAGPRTVVKAFRGEDAALLPVDLATREGLVGHLAALRPEPHPAAALDALADSLRGEQPADLVLVTHERVLTDPEMQPALRDVAGRTRLFAVGLDGVGGCRLLAVTPGGLRVLRQARHDLALLVDAPRHTGELKPYLPRILDLDRFPFLLPHQWATDPSLTGQRVNRRFKPGFLRRFFELAGYPTLERLELELDYGLWVAELPCGSRIFLDGRGCLHLVSHRRDLPELSLVFLEGNLVAGWAENEGYGDRRLLCDEPAHGSGALVRRVEAFRAACR